MLQQQPTTQTPPPPPPPPASAPEAAHVASARLAERADLPSLRLSLTPERRNVADAMRLYTRLSELLKDTICERDRHAYRRTLRVHRHAARRLERRHKKISPRPKPLSLGNFHQPPQLPRPEAGRK